MAILSKEQRQFFLTKVVWQELAAETHKLLTLGRSLAAKAERYQGGMFTSINVTLNNQTGGDSFL